MSFGALSFVKKSCFDQTFMAVHARGESKVELTSYMVALPS